MLTKAEGLGLATSFNTFAEPKRCMPRRLPPVMATLREVQPADEGDEKLEKGWALGWAVAVIELSFDAHSFTVLQF